MVGVYVMNDDKREMIPRSVISKLLNVIIIAVGNILIIAGESLIHYGEDNIQCLLEEENKKSLPEDDDFFDYNM